jgi:hypothetical protein
VVIDNLRATSDPDNVHEIPLRHFTDYLNYEEEAMIWFLYEVVTLRWTWGESRLDFVKEMLRNHRDCFDLEKTFPDFPGSPRQTQTVREFLMSFLNVDEQRYVQIPPRRMTETSFRTLSEAFEALRNTKSEKSTENMPQSQQTHQTQQVQQIQQTSHELPTFDWSTVQQAFEESEIDNQEELQKQNKKLNKQVKKLKKQNNKLTEENDLLCDAIESLQDQQERLSAVVEKMKETISKDEYNNSVEEMSVSYVPFVIRFNRESQKDDVIRIFKATDDDDLYNILFSDNESNIQHHIRCASRQHVLNYISSSLRLLRFDHDPYENVQVQIPAGPSILLNPKVPIRVRETIYDCIETCMDNWPIRC